jgi:peptide/nickel transport system substrate-binding protein
MVLNAREGITADVRVRQALNLAVDKEAIVKNLLGGKAAVDPCQILSPSILGFDASLQPYPYDPDKARQLLQEAGVEGEPIELIGESGRWLKDREVIEAVANYWRAVGLDVDVKIYTFSDYLDRTDEPNPLDSFFVSSSNDLLDPDIQLSAYYADGGIVTGNSDPQLKHIIDQARQETEPDKRVQLVHQAVKIACDQAYEVFLYNQADVYGLSARLQFQPRVDGKMPVKEMTVTG